MIGAIIGDIVGSRFEFDNYRGTDFEFFHSADFFTDDSVMSLAVAEAILKSMDTGEDLSALTVKLMKTYGRKYPDCGFGGCFNRWVFSENTKPYNSFGNGAAMRVSPCGFAAKSLDEAVTLADAVTRVTHNHPDGMEAAETTAYCIRAALDGATKDDLRAALKYDMNFTLDEIRPTYGFDETCAGSVPQAIEAFLESTDFESAIRLAVSIGGDSDTIACITGGIAEAYYGVPRRMAEKAKTYLDVYLLTSLDAFEARFPSKIID